MLNLMIIGGATQLSPRKCHSLVKYSFTFIVKFPVDRGQSETHQQNRNASDFYDSYDMELGSSGTDWDAYFCTFSYIVKVGIGKISDI